MIDFAGIGVGGHLDGLAPAHAAEIGFVDVSAEPDVVEIGQRDHRRSRRDHFPEFRLPHENHAGFGRAQRRIAQFDSREFQILVGLGDAGSVDGDLFLAGSLDGLIVGLFCAFVAGMRAGEIGGRDVARLRRRFAAGAAPGALQTRQPECERAPGRISRAERFRAGARAR